MNFFVLNGCCDLTVQYNYVQYLMFIFNRYCDLTVQYITVLLG